MESVLRQIKKMMPRKLFEAISPTYHFVLSFLGALIYWFPSRKITVIGITGTKGKTSTVEVLNAFLEEAGYKTALAGTLRFKVGKENIENKFKMTMPGRFFVQKLLRCAVNSGCQFAIVEMTSQGVLQSRHRFISLDALIFTNLAPEHIEAHGSYEKYLEAKLKIAKSLEKSNKKNKAIISNIDDKEGEKFLNIKVKNKYPYSIKDAEPYSLEKNGLSMTYDSVLMRSHLSGLFNVYNILAASFCASHFNVETSAIKKALKGFKGIRGRVEHIDMGQEFNVIVDYAHTPDSLEKVYEVFQNSKKICVLGNTGGGRDRWKRKEMAKIAELHCSNIILTNEDPYDEDPRAIIDEMARAITIPKYQIIMDRRNAIKEAIKIADTGDTVIITGKGTDPYIMGPNGTKIEWDDATVAREELEKIINENN
ncbi:hypothetical protein COW81_02915 [Candidatus Campbellbacteria bacterium CG22_combo_CG10-13_8_21_14_all_36_13]|uniref:UDP-N-acetylmuramoyl-L-alanyl-D-glutamate--2, 6-diaminopimelate ligase n=1 Tax=Candidatus Campbellbacteria bacterium CG22_combo_CG10-13_8_21_14_all_36_13 TaxID=1974529 RepID=A0A2H0DXQ4_9BACT|nr:MAG: hypothetical protein COW81_02915 [Candidatus Campbellbacteria bacterium CG22_combo_CG10-13_8_21_14_all_36_13]